MVVKELFFYLHETCYCVNSNSEWDGFQQGSSTFMQKIEKDLCHMDHKSFFHIIRFANKTLRAGSVKSYALTPHKFLPITLPMVSAALTCMGLEVWAKG